MLTLKAPIQLHIAQTLTGGTEAFGERIRGNYSLLGARFTAKDLLFLMTAPPELPEDLGGMTTLVNQQNTVDVRSVTMDVVNNVVNRILLDGTEQFTYQDQVYITSVLNRLGITNVAQFMEQVRQLRVENESIVHMTGLYREELERILQRQLAGETAPALPLAPQRAEEEPAAPARDPRVTLCMDILNRLETTSLYQTVHAFQRSWTGGPTTIRNQELKLSEQLRFSSAVSLAQLKQQVFQQPELHLLHHQNTYETGGLLEAPKDEEEVLSQAAAAALITAVDNTVVQVLNRPQFRREQWLQVKNALWQVAENTLSRFETYHSQPQPAADLSVRMDMAWNSYVQELREYQTLFQTLYPKAAPRQLPLPERWESGQTLLTQLVREAGRESLLTERSETLERTERETSRTETLLREYLRQTMAAPEELALPSRRADVPPHSETVQLTHREEYRAGDELYFEENSTDPDRQAMTPAPPEREEARPGGAPGTAAPADRETVIRQERERELAGERLRELIRQQPGQEGVPPTPSFEAAPMVQPTAGEPEEGAEGAAEPALVEHTEQENTIYHDNERQISRQTLRELLEAAEPINAGQTVIHGDTLSITYGDQLRQENLIHRWESGEQLTLEEQTVMERLLAAPQLQTLAPPEPAEAVSTTRSEKTYRETVAQRLRELLRQQLDRESILTPQTPGAAPTLHPTAGEPEGAAGAVEHTVTQQTERETHTLQTHDRALTQRTLRELLTAAQTAPGVLSSVTEETLNLILGDQLRQENLIHRWESGDELTVEEQTLMEGLLSAPELQRLRDTQTRIETNILHRERTDREREQVVRERRETAEPQPPRVEGAELSALWPELRRQAEAQPVPPVQPVPLTPREAEEQAPEVLREEITRIDRHNRTILQAVQQESLRREPTVPAGPDLQRTMRDALRALDEPEQVLRELQELRQAEPADLVHPELTAQEEALLRQAEPQDRALYEAILAYRKDPEGALARGLLKPGNLGAFHAEVQKAVREEAPLELEHPGREALEQREWLREQSETVLERFHDLPLRARTVGKEPTPPPAVKIVHKQAPPDVTEELLEQLEEQRTRSVTRTDSREEVTHRQSHQVDVNQVERKVVAQTTEDITELVNRTLARQMRTISDQVYRQMEKRLQAERSRRGRM